MASQNGVGRGTISLALRSLASEENPAPANPEASANALAPTIPASAINDPLATPLPTVTRGQTWDSEVSSAFPSMGGEDGLMTKVQIMRGKDVTETNFQRHDR